MSETSETPFWIKFFMEAGIPASIATEYAITFSDNRIKESMLMDLDKEYLREMGITVLGDVISILKYAKLFCSNTARKHFMNYVKNKETATTKEVEVSTKRNPVAVRMLEHYVRKETIVPKKSGNSSRLNAPIKRPTEEEETLKPSKRNSVFERLGDNLVTSTTQESPKIIMTMLGKSDIKKEIISPSLSKLSKNAPCSKNAEFDDSLQYHGILKYPKRELEERKKANELKYKNSPNLSITIGSHKASPSHVRNRIGTPVTTTRSEGIFAQEFKKEEENVKSQKKEQNIPIKSEKINNRIFINCGKSEKGSFALQKIPPSLQDDAPPTVIKKIIRVNKSTGQIIGVGRKVVHSSAINRQISK